jgi:hypothetical protein
LGKHLAVQRVASQLGESPEVTQACLALATAYF